MDVRIAAGIERFQILSMSRKALQNAVREEIRTNPVLGPVPRDNGGHGSEYEIYDARLIRDCWHVEARNPVSRLLRQVESLEHAGLRVPGDTRDFGDQLIRARYLLAVIQEREDIFKAVVLYLLEREKEFVLSGKLHGGMNVRSVAEVLGLHPLSVQSAKKNIRVRTPSGEFPISQFFDNEEEETVLPAGNSRILDPDGTGKVSEICLIAPTEELAARNREVCRLYGKQVDVCIANLEEAVPVVRKLSARGARIFISRKGTRKSIVEQGDWPVLDIGPDLADYIPALQKASAVKGKVAFFSYGVIQEDVRVICNLMGIDALFYSFYQQNQCEGIVQEAVRAGAVLGIGGANTAKPAARLGFPHYVTENSQLSVLQAIESAEQLLKLQKEEAAKQEELKVLVERYDLALKYTHDAIFVVGEEGQIEVMNQAAEPLAGREGQPAVGRPFLEAVRDHGIDSVLKSGKSELNRIVRLRGNAYNSNLVPIVVDGRIRGVHATYQDVRALQNDEQNVRMKLAEKGLVAKHHFEDIIGESPKLKRAVRMAKRFASADVTVLIHGETGTGKELFAQSIHNASPRAGGPFVAVNCGALPKDILEAELFGYAEGAFTGARKGGKMGLFEMAHNGTIFLDEIGEMPMETQVQLLRVLQEREIRRLGSDRVTPVNIRVIAATNRNLLDEIKRGTFRQDLFFRINVLNIEVPPLRERREDIAPICENLLSQLMPCGPEEKRLLSQVLQERRDYGWPGNVRQLFNLAERLYVLRTQGEDPEFIKTVLRSFSMEPGPEEEKTEEEKTEQEKTGEEKTEREKAEQETSEHVRTGQAHAVGPEEPEPADSGYAQEEGLYEPEEGLYEPEKAERDRILAVLRQTGYSMAGTAELLGINRSTLYRKMKRLGLENRRRIK